jgi:hypothetical protein
MTKPARPERWIFMIDKNASQGKNDAFGKKLETLGASEGVKVVDNFPGTLLVQCKESFARAAQKQFASELKSVHAETFAKLPDTRPKLRKPPTP